MNMENNEGRQYCHVMVGDNGPGILDLMKGAIFDRFRRGDTKAHSSGLGLYLVKALVGGYGGRVWVEVHKKFKGYRNSLNKKRQDVFDWLVFEVAGMREETLVMHHDHTEALLMNIIIEQEMRLRKLESVY